MLIQTAIEVLEHIAPLRLAETWDNVGLLLGNPNAELNKVITCLTVSSSVVDEAIKEKANLIVSHHPILFKPTQRITVESEEGKLLWQLAIHGISVYSPHTAYDNAPGGINEQLAHALQLNDIRPLVPLSPEPSFKIVVFVPESDLTNVSNALFQAGAGVIGNYEQCSFRLAGTGSFFANSSAKPTVGDVGKIEQVAEYRLEVVCPSDRVTSVVTAMRQAHSYEEPAFDVYPLQSTAGSPSVIHGSGRIGTLSRPLTPERWADLVAKTLQTPILLTGHREREGINKVAIVCGAGGSLLNQAIRAGADAFLTGEIRFHDELAAQAAGVTVIAAGHYATERPGIEQLARQLSGALPDCEVWASCAERNPAQWFTFAPNPRSG